MSASDSAREGYILYRYHRYKDYLNRHGWDVGFDNVIHCLQVVGAEIVEAGLRHRPMFGALSLNEIRDKIDELEGNKDWRLVEGGFYYPCLHCGLPTDGISAGGMICGSCDCGREWDAGWFEAHIARIKSEKSEPVAEVVARFERFKRFKDNDKLKHGIDRTLAALKEKK